MSPDRAAVAVIDYKVNNLTSMCRALADAGAAHVEVVERPIGLDRFTHLVLPGVGAFDAGMRHLNSADWPDVLRAECGDGDKPLLGVCLGMQLLAGSSDEGQPTPGLGLIPGTVRRLRPSATDRLPHVGWNTVNGRSDSALLRDLADGLDFYFVHSFQVLAPEDVVRATTPFGDGEFAAMVSIDNIHGVQFHPEKSSTAGVTLLRNFLDAGAHA